MRKNIILFSLLIVLLTSSFFQIKVSAIDYDIGVSEGDSFIWEVETFNEDKYNKYFTEEAEFMKGVSKKHEITDIDEHSKYWKITYDLWDYTKDEDKFTGDPDEDESFKLYKDPEDQGEELFLIEDFLEMWVIPTPYTNYLEELRDEYDNDIINIHVDSDGIVIKYAFSHIEYDIQISYTLDGVAETIQYIESDGDVFVKINLHRETIGGYSFIIIPAIIIAIVYLISKKTIKISDKNV